MQPFQPSQPLSSIQDLEWNSGLSRASTQGAKFALLMAMLEQNILLRPRVVEDEATSVVHETTTQHHYRSSALKAETEHFDNAITHNRIINEQNATDALLWQVMHPDPLSLHNDACRIDENIVANMSWMAQQRFVHHNTPNIQADETGLYEVLQQINPQPEFAQSQ